jgi:hypothetical protein
LSDQFLQDIFQSDHANGAADFINHDGTGARSLPRAAWLRKAKRSLM